MGPSKQFLWFTLSLSWLSSRTVTLHSISFRINTRREGLAHCLCLFGSTNDAKPRDIIQNLAQRYWPWWHKGINLTSKDTFSVICRKSPNSRSTSQKPHGTPSHAQAKNLMWRNHISKNLIGQSTSCLTDPNGYRQWARPSLCVFILKALNAVECEGLVCRTNCGFAQQKPKNALSTHSLTGSMVDMKRSWQKLYGKCVWYFTVVSLKEMSG